MNGTTPTLEVKDLRLKVKKIGLEVVKSVSFSIKPGETVALLGESGAGKSSLFRSILQLLPGSEWDQSGSIQVLGTPIMGKSPRELEAVRGPKVRCIFQEPALSLNPSLKVERQFKEAISVVCPDLSAEQIQQQMDEAIINGGLLPETIRNKYPGDLSGGQRQRVGIAMSLCAPAPLLLADEPSNSLDSVTITELVETMLRLKQTGQIGSLLIVTHDFGVLKALGCERVLFMDDGHLFEVGNIQEVLSNPRQPKLAEMVSLMNAIDSMEHQIHQLPTKKAPETLVGAKEVSFGYLKRSFLRQTRLSTLKDINFTIKENHFVGVVGNSGSGKSTLCKLITQELSDHQGELTFDGKPIEAWRASKNKQQFHRQLQIIFQEPADTFDPSLTMGENLKECFSAMGLSESEVESAFDELLDLLLLDRRMLSEQPAKLSGGQKQRFALMRAFASKPKLLLADEPFNNLDLIAQQRLIELLLARKQDKDNPLGCILVSHDMGVVAKLCDQVLVFDQGQIVEQGPTDQIIHQPKHPATKRLIHAAATLGSIQL